MLGKNMTKESFLFSYTDMLWKFYKLNFFVGEGLKKTYVSSESIQYQGNKLSLFQRFKWMSIS